MQLIDATARPTTTRCAPPLDSIRGIARQTLADLHHLGQPTTINETVWHLHGTAATLQLLADATRADGQHPDTLDHAEQILTHIDRAGYTVELRDAGRMLHDVTATMDALLNQLAPAPGEPEQPKIPNPRPPHPGSVAASTSDPSRTPPRKPSGTGWERTARLDAVTAAWLDRYRTTARRLPHLDAEQLGARVEQHLTGVAA